MFKATDWHCCRRWIRLILCVMSKHALPPDFRSYRVLLRCGGQIAILGVSLALCCCDKGDKGDEGADSGVADASNSDAATESQAIRIERDAKVGDRYYFEGEGRSREVVEMSAEGKPVPEGSRTEDFSATLLADVEVVAIHENNKPAKVSIRVISLTRTDDGAQPVTLLEDTVIDAESEAGGITYSTAGIAVEAKIQQAIKLFTLLNDHSRKADEDAIFATHESHAPGDEWSVDRAAIANSFSQDTGMEIVPDSIVGSMKFEKVDQVGGVACQLLSGQVSMDVASFPGMPEGAELNDSKAHVSLSGAFPIDLSLPVVEKSMAMKMDPSLEYTSNGISVEMKMTMERSVTSKKTLR